MAFRIDDIGFGELKLIQNPDEFCYGVDAVLLADFAAKHCKFRNAVDMGCGNGIIPLILSHKNEKSHIIGIDIIESNINMAQESVRMNGLEDRIEFINMDILQAHECLQRESVDLVTCNPPYFPKGGGIVNGNKAKFTARQETSATIDDFVRAAAFILKERGHLCMIHRPWRLVDIFHACREHRLEPKVMRMISPRAGEIPNMVMIDCVKGGGMELKLEATLNIHGSGNEYTNELLEIYGK